MDKIIKFLGSSYHFFDRYGLFIILLLLLLLVALYLYLFGRPGKRWKKVVTSFFVTIPFFICIGLILFVKSNIEEIDLPDGYLKNDIQFTNGTGHKLRGELLLPGDKKRVPALVFIAGSDVSSYRTNYARLCNEVISKVFSKAGYAILYYDKQGIGGSSGDWTDCSFNDLANDAYSAVTFLKSHPQIDSTKIIIAGHSQGGWIAQLTASQHLDIYSMISMAGPVTGVKEQIADDEINGLICDGMDTVSARAQVNALIKDIEIKSKNATSGRYYHFKKIKDYYPDSALLKLKQPSLFLFGGNDRLVMPIKNLNRLKAIFRDSIPPYFRVVIVPEALHSFRLADSCFNGSQMELRYSELFIEELMKWLTRW